MRVDIFTDIVNVDNNVFLINFRTGAVDQIDENLAGQIRKLKNLGSFSDEECLIIASKLLKLLEKGYITSFTDKDIELAKKNTLEGYKETKKIKEKIPSIVMDSYITRHWCFNDGGAAPSSARTIKLNDFKKIVGQIKECNLSPEINLFWADISAPVLEELSGILKSNNIVIKSIYTLSSASKAEILLKELKGNHFYNDFIIKERDINNHFFHYKYNRDINDFIQVKKLLFCYDDYFICPFLYNTYFIDEKGNMHFCIRKMYTSEFIRNIYDGQSNKQNWSEKMFDNFCDEQGKNCKYSFYCSKMCDYLGHIYKPSTIELCPIPKELDIYVKEKIKILAG